MIRELIVAGAFALLAGLLPASLALAPKAGTPVAVIASPWAEAGDAMRIVAAADGLVLQAAHGGGVAIATSDSNDFIARLYRSGAALVLDGAALAGCLAAVTQHQFFAERTRI
jgi:hypothetical protein